VLFKCGPYGGHRLNELMQERGTQWFNVAHDHPDANHFMLFANGQFWATDDGYPRENKATENHNAILVDGQGMAHRGGGWSQPIARMGEMGRIIGCFGTPGYFAAVGDATNYYAGMTRAWRWLAVVDDAYAVVADALASDAPHEYTWRYHCDGDWQQQGDPPRDLEITKGDAKCRMHVLLPPRGTYDLGPDVLEGRERGQVLSVTPEEPGPQQHFLALLHPLAAGEEWPVSRLQVMDRAGQGVVMLVEREGAMDVLAFNESGAALADDELGLATDGLFAAVTLRNNAVANAVLLNGRTVTFRGEQVLESDREASLRWQAGRDGGVVWSAAPVKGAGGTAVVTAHGEQREVTVGPETTRH
jgi:hypothetical protein